jgi:hypothetical protein
MQILDTAAEILTDSAPSSAWATIVLQRSIALRLQGNSHQSEHEILTFLDKISDISEHLLKPLQLSLAKSRIHQFRYQEAHEITRRIEVGVGISEDEFQLLWDHIYCVGRIVRGQGDSESAKVCFERCCAITYGVRPSVAAVSITFDPGYWLAYLDIKVIPDEIQRIARELFGVDLLVEEENGSWQVYTGSARMVPIPYLVLQRCSIQPILDFFGTDLADSIHANPMFQEERY